MIALTSEYMAQGQASTTAWIVRLGGQGPQYLGRIRAGGRLEDEACSGCEAYDYKAKFEAPRKPGDMLSVSYASRVQTASGRWRPFRRRTDYRLQGGKLVPTTPITLPDLGGSPP